MEFDTVIAIVGLMIAANVPTYAIMLYTLQRVEKIADNCKFCEVTKEVKNADDT